MSSLQHPLIQEIGTEIDKAYTEKLATLQHYPEINRQKGRELKIVYTSLHGTGITVVPKALASWGFPSPLYVDSQIIPDGSFPTLKTPPNPEIPATLQMGIDKMLATNSDVLIATDPDADRIGVSFIHEGKAVSLNGNQTLAICLEHVCEALTSQKRLPPRAAFVKSIVTTELCQAICNAYHLPCFNVLTGFKYIAEKIHEWETLPDDYQDLFGGEESYGCLLGTFVRDKDAVGASCLVSEVALHAKLQGKSLWDRLEALYERYGLYHEQLLSINFSETKEGKEQMGLGMQRLRGAKLDKIQGVRVIAIEDYLISTKFELASGQTTHLALPVSDVLLYWLEDGSKIVVRPSGTEPKVKVYCDVVEKHYSSLAQGAKQCAERSQTFLSFIQNHLR